MSTANPLVATASNAPVDPWSGVWIAQDIETLCDGVKNGSWIEGTLGAVSAGLDALALISDPIGALLQYGVAWIIDHVKPLSEALDWLAGDPAQIAAHAQTWHNVAGALHDWASDLDQAVRVLQSLADLPNHRQLRGQRNTLLLTGQPQVEPLPLLVVRVDQPDAEFRLDQVTGAQQPVVLQPGHDTELVFGDLPGRATLRLTRRRRQHTEPDPGPVLLDNPVVGEPVLPTLVGVDGLVLDDPRAGFAFPALHEPDALQQHDQDVLLIGANRPLSCRLEYELRDASEATLQDAIVETVKVDRARRAERAAQVGMMEEHRLLHERDDVPLVRDLNVLLLRPQTQLIL